MKQSEDQFHPLAENTPAAEHGACERSRKQYAQEEQLREALALNERILMTSPVGISAYRQDGQCVQANPALAELVGGTEAQLLAQNFRQVQSWRGSGLLEVAERVLAGGTREELEARFTTSFGREIWVHGQLSRFTSRGEPHLLVMLQDITEKRQAAQLLAESERAFRSLADNVPDNIVRYDCEGRVLYVNPCLERTLGCRADELLGRTAREIAPDGRFDRLESAVRQVAASGECIEIEQTVPGPHGETRYHVIRIVAEAGPDGRVASVLAVGRDLTEMRRKDERIHHLAFHDALTGLPNRTLMQDRLQHALARAQREGRRLSVTFIDLDRFKAVNDALGHDVGDLLLQEVARRIQRRLRASDTVARLGGDEFVLLMEDLKEAGHCASLAQQLIAEIAQPMHLRGNTVQIGASMGMAFYPEDGANAVELMKRADLAMYAAKSAGRNTYRFFQQDMLERTSQRLSLEMDLRRAIANGHLELHYQPRVELATGEPRGVEALVRWRHPTRGLLPPAEFIPLAEESALILELGEWVLGEACRQAAEWRARGRGIRIAVNVSARQLEAGDLVERIAELARHHGIAPTDLEVELTESAVMAHPAQAAGLLGRLRRLGVTVAVDDFGTGYSSLAYLRRLPIDILKIDRSFVVDADRNEEDAQIVKTILALGQSLRLTVVAEGIETGRQAELLQALGCTLGQGYLFSRPLPARECEAWLDAAARGDGYP